MNTDHQQTDKLIPFDLLPARIGEVALFCAGELSEAEYPKWVRKLGVALGNALFPKDWCISAKNAPAQFFEGFSLGLVIVLQEKNSPPELELKKNSAKAKRVIQAIAHRDVAQFDINEAIRLIRKPQFTGDIVSRFGEIISLKNNERTSFFHGFLIGLDFEKAIQAGMAEMTKRQRSRNDFFVLKAFLWLTWPEIEAQGSIIALFDHCSRAFRTTSIPRIVGSDDSFRRFCNRIKLSYKKHSKATRKGQNR